MISFEGSVLFIRCDYLILLIELELCFSCVFNLYRSWDHHDFLSVIPEYNSSSHCSTSARLRSIAPYSGRKETAVYAADVHTGTVIRCKVFVDYFSRIQIFHNSIKLDLDGLATLRVRAFDAEGICLLSFFCCLLCCFFTLPLLLEKTKNLSNLSCR